MKKRFKSVSMIEKRWEDCSEDNRNDNAEDIEMIEDDSNDLWKTSSLTKGNTGELTSFSVILFEKECKHDSRCFYE